MPRSRILLIAMVFAVVMAIGCGGPAAEDSSAAALPATPSTLNLSPPAAVATGQPLNVEVSGSGFDSHTVVTAGGQAISPVVESASRLQFTVPGELLNQAQNIPVRISQGSAASDTDLNGNLTVLPAGAVSATGNSEVAQYTMDLPPGASMQVEFGPGANYGRTTWSRTASGTGISPVSILVAGMQASTAYHLRATVTFADGSAVEDSDHTFSTGRVWDPQIPAFTVDRAGAPSGGVELVNSTGSAHGQAVITDLQGNILWTYLYEPLSGWVFPFRLMPNGDIIMILSDYASSSSIREVTLGNSIVRQIGVGTLNAELQKQGADFQFAFLDHDILPLPNGHVIVLGTVYKTYQDVAGTTGSTNVEGNAIVDLDQNFIPVWTWNAFDHLDVSRHPMLFPDWLHANALLFTKDGNLLLSLRHQSWIIKIDYENGKGNGDVLWKLGYQGDFQLAGGDASQWFYGQHMPTIVSENGAQMKLAVFDDGNGRVMDPQGDRCGTGAQSACYSRAVIVTLDQDTMSAQVDWEYRPGLFTPWGGSTQVLPNGDVEFDMSQPFPGSNTAEVMEVTQTTSPQVVWQMKWPQNMYRAYRIPSFYPGVQW